MRAGIPWLKPGEDVKASITISKTTVRRFVLGRQGLWPGRRWAGSATLVINGFWLEEHAPVEDSKFVNALVRSLVRFAEFLDAHQVNISVLEPAALCKQVRKYMGDVFEIRTL